MAGDSSFVNNRQLAELVLIDDIFDIYGVFSLIAPL